MDDHLRGLQTNKQTLFQNLKRQILLREGFKEVLPADGAALGRINQSFPNAAFPFSSLHEFFSFQSEEVAATSAFVSGLLSSRLKQEGTAVWISSTQKLFPPALKWFGIAPHQVLFLHIKKEKDVAWAIDEALKCASLSAVVGELPEMSITESRRFQLSIEESGVGCFVLRHRPKNLLTTAVSRWHIQPVHSLIKDELPGISHPRWKVNLLKVRNGKPASWEVEWSADGFKFPSRLALIHQALQKQTG